MLINLPSLSEQWGITIRRSLYIGNGEWWGQIPGRGVVYTHEVMGMCAKPFLLKCIIFLWFLYFMPMPVCPPHFYFWLWGNRVTFSSVVSFLAVAAHPPPPQQNKGLGSMRGTNGKCVSLLKTWQKLQTSNTIFKYFSLYLIIFYSHIIIL